MLTVTTFDVFVCSMLVSERVSECVFLYISDICLCVDRNHVVSRNRDAFVVVAVVVMQVLLLNQILC